MADIIVAGNTSGAITISAPLVAGSGTLTLPVATDTLIGKATTDTLTNKSIAATQLTGTIAASALPAGSVLQVVQASTATPVTSSSASLVTTGFSASITPRSTSSKILILANLCGCQSSTLGNGGQHTIYRNNTTNLGAGGSSFNVLAFIQSGAANIYTNATMSFLDSPSTTSATSYTCYFAVNSGTVSINSAGTSTITLMEIQG